MIKIKATYKSQEERNAIMQHIEKNLRIISVKDIEKSVRGYITLYIKAKPRNV
ncbi:MAG: hypothetical protein ACK5MV_03905 [Aminipila sp.]